MTEYITYIPYLIFKDSILWTQLKHLADWTLWIVPILGYP